MNHFNTDKLEGVFRALLVAVVLGICPCAMSFHQCNFTEDEVVNFLDFAVLAESWTQTLPWGPDGLPPQMLSHWQLDGDANDSQSSYNGIVYGDPVWVTSAQAKVGNGAVYMNGQDYIAIEATDYPDFTGSLTIDAWIKPDDNDQNQIIISKGQSSWQIGIEGQSKKAFFSCNGLAGTSCLVGSTSLTNGIWYHLAGVYEQAEEKIYLYMDEFLDADANASGTIDANTNDIWIGGNPEQPESGFWWLGYIDNIRVYNYALDANEIFHYKTLHVDVERGNDNNNGSGRNAAYKTIQQAIDTADNSDTILVWPGVYNESINFRGKAITIKSAADAAVIRSPGSYAVKFYFGEQANSVLENFIIKDSEVGISVSNSSPTLKYLTIVNNNYAIDLWGYSLPHIESCILWNNTSGDIFTEAFFPEITYSCIERAVEGEGNISIEPLFVDPNIGDYHLRSQLGRYLSDQSGSSGPKPENWVTDEDNSPCIDAGRATVNPMCESMPNGGRVNIGAYGGTPFASKSPWPLKADVNYNGQVFMDDLNLFFKAWLVEEP